MYSAFLHINKFSYLKLNLLWIQVFNSVHTHCKYTQTPVSPLGHRAYFPVLSCGAQSNTLEMSWSGVYDPELIFKHLESN